MSTVLLILNHNFVALPEAESIIINKKQEINLNHSCEKIDQFLLSNIVLGNVELIPNHYDFIYYLNPKGDTDIVPNHPAIKQSLKLSSAVPITLKKEGSTSSTSTTGKKKLSGLKFKRLAKKPIESTSSNTVPLGVQIEEPITPKSPSPSPSIPELSPVPIDQTDKKLRYFSDDSESDDELINEDELIESNLLNTSSIICLREPSNENGPKRRKACKDCTCGLAEKEAFSFNGEEESPKEVEKPKIQFSAKELTEIDFTVEGKTGGCGSCSLGDAFRCSGCPFLGLPAFKPGQAINLSSIDDDL
ncbi:hypothetical protein BN7_2610 [Wickerhamomyces ciferrii]|uniref:Uncharacterized protein n=1 Tax=Wickerhamomyces ciferrii (strain ATCC 14091 / BCRC 22168 / CBS 111 / JCM 3599 / NBRC 0793 / NRRL Y-1031 F-60-10) TaxID=1206466 RepID=K0KPI0_WICCF|nr:uncharacterized protein BN7_2610 [Wickerhamomyces ciferrii]CCH43063.1 hypothetical protein BN7_2610 [Wickerhamomyces ciferrii]